VLHPARDTHIEAGSTVVLTCVAYGVPPPSLIWSRNGSLLSSNDSHVTIYSELMTDSGSGVVFAKSIMKLCRSELTDVGTYSCLTSNDIGDDSFTFELTLESLEADIVVHPEAATEFKGGSTVLLTCAASGLPLPSLSWTQHSTELNNGSGFIIHQRLVTEVGISFITSILEVCSANASTYTCSAYHHNGGDFFTSVIEIQAEELLRLVLHPESNVEFDDGHTTLYFCVSFGFPLPSISWFQNGAMLANTSHISISESLVTVGGVTFVKSSLEVCSIDESNGTLYLCVADNGIHVVNFEIHLLVAAAGKHFSVNDAINQCISEGSIAFYSMYISQL